MQSVRRFAVALISALGVLGVVASAAPAEARVVANEPFHEVGSELNEQICPGLTLGVDTDIKGRMIINTHGPDGLVYFMTISHGTVSLTNLANGKSLTLITNTVIHDLKVIDNGDGTFTVVQAHSGITRVEGSTGRLGVKRTGTVRFQIVVNRAGTPTDPSDDVELDVAIVKLNTGQSDIPGGECALLQ
jgi:hypothetical protein